VGGEKHEGILDSCLDRSGQDSWLRTKITGQSLHSLPRGE